MLSNTSQMTIFLSGRQRTGALCVTPDSGNCTAESVVTTCAIWRKLERSSRDFVKNVLQEHSHSIHDPIKKNSVVLFRKPHCKTNSTQGKRIKVLQNNVALCGQLYVSMQNRDSDFAGSLKESTREKRGKGMRMKV